MDYTPEEQHSANRDATALIRALHEGNGDLYEAILDAAGDRGRRAIAETLVTMAHAFLLRAVFAVQHLPEETAEAVIATDDSDIAAIPGLREAVSAELAALQAEYAAED